jgi:hypothetical protein
MGDDFDLFPKRENLDPFAFGKKEKSTEADKPDSGEDLFGQDEQALGSLPDLSSSMPEGTPEAPPPLPDLPLGEPEASVLAPQPGMPPLQPPPPSTAPVTDTALDPLDGILSEGPISGEKTFDEPVFEQKQDVDDVAEKRSRKSPSPFVVIGGALIIIIGLLYGALTYLKRDNAPIPVVSLPPVSVAVSPLKPVPVPVPVPVPSPVAETEVAQTQGGTPPAGETTHAIVA